MMIGTIKIYLSGKELFLTQHSKLSTASLIHIWIWKGRLQQKKTLPHNRKDSWGIYIDIDMDYIDITVAYERQRALNKRKRDEIDEALQSLPIRSKGWSWIPMRWISARRGLPVRDHNLQTPTKALTVPVGYLHGTELIFMGF